MARLREVDNIPQFAEVAQPAAAAAQQQAPPALPQAPTNRSIEELLACNDAWSMSRLVFPFHLLRALAGRCLPIMVLLHDRFWTYVFSLQVHATEESSVLGFYVGRRGGSCGNTCRSACKRAGSRNCAKRCSGALALLYSNPPTWHPPRARDACLTGHASP